MPSLTLHSDEVVNGTKADLRRWNVEQLNYAKTTLLAKNHR